MEGYISTKEAAAIMGVSDSYVRRLAKNNKIDSLKIGWSYIIKRSAAQVWQPKRKVKPPKE